MKRTFYILGLAIINGCFLSTSFAQVPHTTPDNIASGNCLDFDGTNDFVSVVGAGMDLGTSDFTAELWVRPNAFSDGGGLVGENNPGGGNPQWYIRERSSNGTLEFITENGGYNQIVTDAPVLTLNEWTHVAAVRDGTNMLLYVNGELNETVSGTVRNVTSAGDFVIGRLGAGFFNSQIDEVRVWNVARPEADIKGSMCQHLEGNESGLIGYWRMNEGTGNAVNDLTANNNNGTRQ